jgi:hypothetical protein
LGSFFKTPEGDTFLSNFFTMCALIWDKWFGLCRYVTLWAIFSQTSLVTLKEASKVKTKTRPTKTKPVSKVEK